MILNCKNKDCEAQEGGVCQVDPPLFYCTSRLANWKLTNMEKTMKRKNKSLTWVPFWVKKKTASALMRMLSMKHLDDDIILFNELKRWIDSDGKPTTPHL